MGVWPLCGRKRDCVPLDKIAFFETIKSFSDAFKNYIVTLAAKKSKKLGLGEKCCENMNG